MKLYFPLLQVLEVECRVGLLRWIEDADRAAQEGEPRPPLQRPNGEPLFPHDEPWWLTDLERRNAEQPECPADLEDATLDEADLTFLAEEAGIEATDRDTTEDSGSEHSIPPGPPPPPTSP